MDYPGLMPFISDLPKHHVLSSDQYENITRLVSISKKFLKKAEIEQNDTVIESQKTIVLESGHQPNFLPHAGTWKKAFLLNQIFTKLKKSGNLTVAFFGFADQNISTARLLSKNQFPDLNKNGFTKIGFKIRDEDKPRSFNRVAKPSAEEWQKETDRIGQHFRFITEKTQYRNKSVRNQWDMIFDIFGTSYHRAENFAELNAIVFARICREIFDLNLLFFLYSDMHHENLFLEESKKILRNVREFNQVYNQEIVRNNLDIPTVPINHLPFWYECDCGVKLDLLPDASGTCELTCPVCMNQYTIRLGPDFENLEHYFKNMDFNAVSRNIIMAHGLGVSLFLSGTGGSFTYGRISDSISTVMGFHNPATLAWQSGDRYLGMMQKIVLWDLMKTFSLTPEDLLSASLNEKFEEKQDSISHHIGESEARNNLKEKKYWTGLRNSARSQVEFTRKFFSGTPSFIDILANFEQDTIIQMWEKAIDYSEVQKTGYQYRIRADINYPAVIFQDIKPAELPLIYESLKKIGV